MLESEYTVVSNINRHGIAPVEAAAHIVDLIERILKTGKVEWNSDNRQTDAPQEKNYSCKIRIPTFFCPHLQIFSTDLWDWNTQNPHLL